MVWEAVEEAALLTNPKGLTHWVFQSLIIMSQLASIYQAYYVTQGPVVRYKLCPQ